MRRKVAYLLVGATLLFTFSIWYVPRHTWRAVSWDGYSVPDKGMGAWITTWKLMNNGATVTEGLHKYSSSEDACNQFQEILKQNRAITEVANPEENHSRQTERIVRERANVMTGEVTIEIVKLQGREIRIIHAGSVSDALAFERDWLKIDL